MKLLAWDEVSGTTCTALQLQQATEDVCRMGLRQRMDYLEQLWSQIEGGVDPVSNPVYWETPGGTWIKYGRCVIRQWMNSMIAANPRNDLQCAQDLKAAVDEFCDLPTGEEAGWLAARQTSPQEAEPVAVEPASTNLIATNVEGDDCHVFWVAYFQDEPTNHDFTVAYEDIRLDGGKGLEPDPVEEQPNALSRKLGLRRYYMGQAV